MFTVLIAEKEHIEAIRQENRLFFEPFLENNELAVCEWNPMGQNLRDSVPGLPDTVGRRKDWRAVIVNRRTEYTAGVRNPFDVVDVSGLNGLIAPIRQPGREVDWNAWEEEWKAYYEDVTKEKEAVYKSALSHPLQKLSTWLCFKPEDYILNDVQETQDIHEWAMEKISEDEVKPSTRLELMERAQYKVELRMKEQIRREFVADALLNIARPTEVHCIALRTSDNSFFDPDDYWSIRRDSEYSAFADRNMYFDKMRFVVFDILPGTHRNFRNDYIRFLASLLIFVSNPVPGSAMQARRLYRLETESDDTPLCTLVTSYDKKLAATFEVIENEMERIRGEMPGELSDKAAEAMFCTSQDVEVLLDESCKPDKVYAEQDYGLAFDLPENEFHKWNKDYKTSEEAISYIIKQQSRSVKKSVGQAHQASEISDVNVSRLTKLQIEDIKDYTDTAENQMVESLPPDLTTMSRYTDRMKQEAENVRKKIDRRMTAKASTVLTLICLAMFLICFLPFLLDNKGTPMTTSTAIVLSGVMVGLLAVILFVTLFVLRTTVVNAVKSYNSTMRGIMNEIQEALKQFSRYLSAFCNVRRGHAVQNYAKKNLDEYTKSLRIRKKHQEDIRKRRAFLFEGYQDYFADKTFCDEVMSRPYDYDFDQKKEYAYPAPFLAGDCRQIEFMCGGNLVTVPSSYVTKLLVRMEGIYDK